MKKLVNDPPLKGARLRLKQIIEDHGNVTLKGLSTQIGRNDAYLHQYLYRGTPRHLSEWDRKQLALILEIDETALMEDTFVKMVGRPSGAPLRRGLPLSLDSKDLPIMGRARASNDDTLLLEGGLVGMTERPSYLQGVEDAFSVYVQGDSMRPRFKSGELVYINPHKPANTGDDVLIEFDDHTGVVKELVKTLGSKLIARQYNPPKDIVYDLKKVKRISLVEGGKFR